MVDFLISEYWYKKIFIFETFWYLLSSNQYKQKKEVKKDMKKHKIRELVEEKLLSSYESMYRIAYTYVRDADDALDIVQDSAYKAIKYADSVKSDEYIETWIFKIVINSAIDFMRKNKREMLTGIPEEFSNAGTTDHYRDFDTLRALDVLNKKERTVILLRFFEDKKLEEIAHIIKSNLNTTKSILYRSLKKLKNELERGNVYE